MKKIQNGSNIFGYGENSIYRLKGEMTNQNHPLVVNIYKDKLYVYVGRKRFGMHFGSPFSFTNVNNLASVIVGSREESVQAYSDWLDEIAWLTVEPERREWILSHIPDLRDKRLGCFCAPKLCHGTILAIRANR